MSEANALAAINEAIERCAQILDHEAPGFANAAIIAARIRALKEQP